MINKVLLTVNTIDEIEVYHKLGVKNFAMPLANFCIGFEASFTMKEILELSFKYDIYVIINRILNSKEIDEFKNLTEDLMYTNIKGVIFSDLGVFKVLRDQFLTYELIWNIRHFGTNSQSINHWLNQGCSSVIVASEITKENVNNILAKAQKPLIIDFFGYNMASYSRRKLITNYNKFYKQNLDNKINLKLINNDLSLLTYETDYGTSFFAGNIYSAALLFPNIYEHNIKNIFINTSFIDKEVIIKIINLIKNNKIDEINDLLPNIDEGFLNRKTIYKLKDDES